MKNNQAPNLTLYQIWKEKGKQLPNLNPSKQLAFEIFYMIERNYALDQAFNQLNFNEQEEFLKKLIEKCERIER